MEAPSSAIDGGNNFSKTPVTHPEAESELKIRQDKMDSEKIMSFVNVGIDTNGGRGGGVSIRFSEAGRQDRGRGEGGVAPSPDSASQGGENIHSQLAAVKLKLEQKRKKIEEDKRRMELLMSRQREKVGQEAFLRAVSKGMNNEGCEGGQEIRKPFILNHPPSSSKVNTPEVEGKTLDLSQLQRGLQRITATKQTSPQHKPFFISQQKPQSTAPQLQEQPQQQQQQQQGPAGVHPYYLYPSHPPPPPWYGMMPYPPHPHPYYPGYPPPPHPQLLPPQQQQQQPQSPITSISEKPAPLTDKPSLSSSFLEMKRLGRVGTNSNILILFAGGSIRLSPGLRCRVSPPSEPLSLPPPPMLTTPPPGARVATALRSNRACHPGSPILPVFFIKVSFSFLRSKQRQHSNGLSHSPRKPIGIEQLANSSHNNLQTQLGNSGLSPEQPTPTINLNGNNEKTDNAIVDSSPPLVLTQSTIDTLNSMTTEEINKEEENDYSKGTRVDLFKKKRIK